LKFFMDKTTFVRQIVRFRQGRWAGTQGNLAICNSKIDYLARAVNAPSTAYAKPFDVQEGAHRRFLRQERLMQQWLEYGLDHELSVGEPQAVKFSWAFPLFLAISAGLILVFFPGVTGG
jgi:hypothetical protein